MGSTRCDVNTRLSGTSGSLICCSSFCFRDVQGLNGFLSRACMSLQISRLSRLLLLMNEGNAIPQSFVMWQTFYPCHFEFEIVLECASICCTPVFCLGETGQHAPLQPLAEQIQPPALGLFVGCPIYNLLRVS